MASIYDQIHEHFKGSKVSIQSADHIVITVVNLGVSFADLVCAERKGKKNPGRKGVYHCGRHRCYSSSVPGSLFCDAHKAEDDAAKEARKAQINAHTAEEKAAAYAKHCADTGQPMFASATGICWACHRQIFDYMTIEEASRCITGCPCCNRTYCD